MDSFTERQVAEALALIDHEASLIVPEQVSEPFETVELLPTFSLLPSQFSGLHVVVQHQQLTTVQVRSIVEEAVIKQRTRQAHAAMVGLEARKRQLEERTYSEAKRRKLQISAVNQNLNGVVHEALRLLEENSKTRLCS
jgi:hypothetical protein